MQSPCHSIPSVQTRSKENSGTLIFGSVFFLTLRFYHFWGDLSHIFDMGRASDSWILFSILRLFFQRRQLSSKDLSRPKEYCGYGIYIYFSSPVASSIVKYVKKKLPHIDLELQQTHFQGLPIDSSKTYFSNLDLSNHGYFFLQDAQFCSSQGQPIRQILPLSSEFSSCCLARESIYSSILHLTQNKRLMLLIFWNGNIGYQSYTQHIFLVYGTLFREKF